MNVELIKLNSNIAILKEEYTKELNTVNHEFWPKDAEIKKEKKNYVWFTAISVCLFFVVVLSVICEILINEYLIGGSLILSFALVLLLVKKTRKILITEKVLNNEWEKSLEKSNQMKKDLDQMISKAIPIMLMEIDKINPNINVDEDTKENYEEVYDLYNSVVNADE